LFAIAQRKVVDAARSRPHESATSDELEDAAACDDPRLDGGVWTKVAALPSKQREAIGLRFLGDLSHADVAEVMGTTVEAARRNVFEGLKRLRKDLLDDRDDP
jgi:DNA-directed RNA polymerase specialized sigma24 family protein